MSEVTLLLGTNKGVFLLSSSHGRTKWSIDGPRFGTWPVNHVKADPGSGLLYAGGVSWFEGASVWCSRDSGDTWDRCGDLPEMPDGTTPESVWSIGFAGDRVLAGVKPGGLYESRDGGDSWVLNRGLFEHPTRPDWPPGGAGLTLHHIVTDPGNTDRIWVGVSSAGIFYTEDGGLSWAARNQGIKVMGFDGNPSYPEIGNCVHGLALAPSGGGQVMYQQGHQGMYRSDNGGARWEELGGGLPSSFGFPVAIHPRDHQTAWFLPLNGDVKGRYVPDAAAAVWKTTDGGASWRDARAGLPQEHCYFTVLRQAMATDSLDPVGVYFGTNSGSVYASTDEGGSWTCLARDLPLVNSVELLPTSPVELLPTSPVELLPT
ncbi:sialidase family protein [Mesobacterium pallidum]|uniref:sialidase family protein n=1 Tax=Mesobacterium pallidum TaxID=2872037 RepID=UPI001EE2091D|nr:sialidase family protein [Mesobacterium pallidum]